MSPPVAGSGGTQSARSARLIVPSALVVVGTFALCAGLAFLSARQNDLHHQQVQRQSMLGAIDEFRNDFAEFTRRRAVDLGAVIWTVESVSVADILQKLSPNRATRYRHDVAYFIGADGNLIASYPPGETTIPPALARLAQTFRASYSDQDRFAETVPDLPDEGIASVGSDFILLENKPAFAAVAAVRSVPNGALIAGGLSILVLARGLDLSLMSVFEKTSGVADSHLDLDATMSGRDFASLLDAQGRIVGWLSWKTQSPTMDSLARIAPLVGIFAIGLVGFAGYSVWHVRRTTRDLATSKAMTHKMAQEDPLTGLPNRRQLIDQLDRHLVLRKNDQLVAFAFLNLDGFKEVNDAVGHQAGDQLLAAVGKRLRQALPASATIGRISGDEFAIVMFADTDPSVPASVAGAVLEALSRPFWIAGQTLQVRASIGFAQAPGDGELRDDLIRRANIALRTAKRHGHLRVVGFERGMEKEQQDRRFIDRELRRALAENSLEVHYQPIVAADGQRVVGVEALVRWQHPTRGAIPPSEFVPIAEQAGLMNDLGEFVLRRALTDALHWKDIYIAVNMSPLQMRDPAIVDVVGAMLEQSGIDAARVVLEITEGVLIGNPEEARERLEQLRRLGVKIALDDFGSGYSSLSYLRRFPFDKLKIAKEFVDPLGRSANGGVIIQAIMALGRALDLTVLCEGIETEEQRILLRLAGCDEMQGYLFAKPGPRRVIDKLLAPARTTSQAARAVGAAGTEGRRR